MLAGAKAAILVFADPEKTDVWTEDCAIAMSNMHLMAHHLGLGSCWIQGPPAPGGGRYLHRGLLPRAALRPGPLHLGGHSLPGFPAIQPEPHSLEDLPREKIHWIPSNPFPGTVQKNVCTRSRPGTHVFI